MCGIGGRLLRGVSDGSSIIDKTVKENILSNSSIKDMARNCGMGVSAFKSEFLCRYGTSPHRWIVEQRLVACPIPVALLQPTV